MTLPTDYPYPVSREELEIDMLKRELNYSNERNKLLCKTINAQAEQLSVVRGHLKVIASCIGAYHELQ